MQKEIKIYELLITTYIDYEFEELNKKFFLRQEDVNKFKEDYLKKHTDGAGKYIPGINSIEFEESVLSLDEFKEEATIKDLEELLDCSIDISGYFK